MNDLAALSQIIRDRGWNIYRIARISEDGTVEEETLQKGNRCTNVYSIAKAFCVAAAGVLYDEGKWSPDEKILSVLGDEVCATPAEGWSDVTLDHLLRHRCGMPGGFLDIDAEDPSAFGRDYLSYAFSQPLLCPPDTQRSYSDGAYYLIGRAVAKKAGMPLDLFLRERIMEPLGFGEVAWSRCPQGHAMGATGLYLRAGDTVKLGGLWLKGGEWQGERLLSREWIDLTLERGYEFNPVGSRGGYGKGGMYGQMLLVLPHEGCALAWQGHDGAAKSELCSICAE
ncbi:MAG: beta-lactamase family protein [Clostridia bacterium]|nr:beta-lactamase family protein [Clostridia bacterium]